MQDYAFTVNYQSQRITAMETSMLFFIKHLSVKEYTI